MTSVETKTKKALRFRFRGFTKRHKSRFCRLFCSESVGVSKIRPHKQKDLAYELQLLLGAEVIVALIEKSDAEVTQDQDKFGNAVNYFKDSVYLHSRNLLNLLTRARYTELGQVTPGIRSDFYGKWKRALERHVMHLEQARDHKGDSNRVGSEYLNQQTHKLTQEVIRCWNEWINTTSNQSSKEKLKKVLSDAQNSANDDEAKLAHLMRAKS